eukprot:UN28022
MLKTDSYPVHSVVQLHNLEATEYNNFYARIISEIDADKMYHIMIGEGDQKIINQSKIKRLIMSGNSVNMLKPRDLVQTHRLENAVHLNSKLGFIEGIDGKTGRWLVTMDRIKLVKIKNKNLQIVQKDCFQPGDVVVFIGLRIGNLNGKKGTVVVFDPERRRYLLKSCSDNK